jgi:hypothetical protein
MVDLHGEFSRALHGLLGQQDRHDLRLHITVQNKVPRAAARALQTELTEGLIAQGLTHRSFRFRGLGLHLWRDELWQLSQLFPFRARQ